MSNTCSKSNLFSADRIATRIKVKSSESGLVVPSRMFLIRVLRPLDGDSGRQQNGALSDFSRSDLRPWRAI